MRLTRALRPACLSIGLTLSAVSAAQTGAAPPMEAADAALSDRAKAYYVEGMKAAEAKNWVQAHAAFLEAWRLNEHYQIAANLGSMEIKLGKYRDAAEHLSVYLRKAPQDKVKDRMRALAFYEEAKKKVGTVQVTVNVNGAEILVDDKVVGISPMLDDIYVDPGPRFIKVRKTGHNATETTIEAAAGSTHQVPLTMGKPPEPPKPEVEPAPPPPVRPVVPESDAFKPKREVVIAGVAVTAVGLVAGTIFAVVSSGQATDADDRMGQLEKAGGPNACTTGVYQSECDTLRDLRGGRDTFGNLAVWSFITAGLAGTGTAIYALVLPSVSGGTPDSEPAPAPKSSARFTPVVTPQGGGLMVTGSF